MSELLNPGKETTALDEVRAAVNDGASGVLPARTAPQCAEFAGWEGNIRAAGLRVSYRCSRSEAGRPSAPEPGGSARVRGAQLSREVAQVQELFGGASGLGWVAIKAVLLFAVAVIGLRFGERRTLTQLNAFDFTVAVAIGSIIGRTVTAASTSFATGAVALVTLLAAHRVVAFARQHSRVARAIDHPPRVLVADGRMQHPELARAGLTSSDVYVLLRGHDVDDLSQVAYLLYEPSGRTTLIRAGEESGAVIRQGLAAAGYLNDAGQNINTTE